MPWFIFLVSKHTGLLMMAEFNCFTYGTISTLQTTHQQGFSSFFAIFLQKMKKNLIMEIDG